MHSVYRLKASELNNYFLEELKTTYQDKEIEITVYEVDKTKDILKSKININQEKALESRDNVINNQNIVDNNVESLSQRRSFLKLSVAERRRILNQQASEMVEHYQNNTEWQEWLLGDNYCDRNFN